MKWYPIIRILLYLREIESKEKIMKKVSNDMRWFVAQLRMAEGILANALERAENFSEHDKRIISKIRNEVNMADLTLLQFLIVCLAPRFDMRSHKHPGQRTLTDGTTMPIFNQFMSEYSLSYS